MKQDNKYLDALVNNDSIIALEIYTKFFPRVASFVSQNKGNADDAQDVFQDALLYLIYVYKEKSISINSFEAYLFTICKNIWRRRLKNKKEWVMKDRPYPLIDKSTDRSLFIVDQQQMELYTDNFSKLSENCKNVLGLYFNTMNYDDILDQFSYNSIDVARQRVFKCRKKLIELIKNDMRYPKFKK